MRALLLVGWLIASPPIAAEPTHRHCWHAQTGSVVPLDDVCCWCGMLRHCVGHGPYAPGCHQSKTETFPLLGRDEPETLRYDYDRTPPGSPYRTDEE